jgi:hypothetical protein
MMASLSSLPFELVTQIIKLIPRKRGRHSNELRLSPLATVSRTWQTIVEAITFVDLSIESKEWSTFVVHICSSRMDRRSYLQVFRVIIKDLESLDNPLLFKENSASDQKQYGQRLNRTVQDIYKEIGSWGKHLNLKRFYLSFPPHPIVAQSYSQDYQSLVARIPYLSMDWMGESENREFHLSGIQEFYLGSDGSRIAPASALSLASTLPDVEYLDMEFDEHEKKDISWRKDLRKSKTSSRNIPFSHSC